MTRARTKAEQLAQFGGAQLGAVQRISEGDAQPQPSGPLPAYRMDAAAANVPTESGQLAVTVSVQVTFGLQ